MITIRKAREEDSEQLFELMKELAIFEQYSDRFAITPEIVTESGFRKTPPDFHAFVAVDGESLVGMLVYYFLPYTAQNKPDIYMKELYIVEAYRGQAIGQLLMEALQEEGKRRHCGQIKWTVAPWNEASQRFYQRLGAKENTDWLHYEMEL